MDESRASQNVMAARASSGSSPTSKQPAAACSRTRNEALASLLEDRIGVSARIPTWADLLRCHDAESWLRMVIPIGFRGPGSAVRCAHPRPGMQTLVFFDNRSSMYFPIGGIRVATDTRSSSDPDVAPPARWAKSGALPTRSCRGRKVSKADEYSAIWFWLRFRLYIVHGLPRESGGMDKTKQYILDEIKRTATANGNVPLGARQFERELHFVHMNGVATGLVLVIAKGSGFEANTKNAAIPDDELLWHLASLARELDRRLMIGEIE